MHHSCRISEHFLINLQHSLRRPYRRLLQNLCARPYVWRNCRSHLMYIIFIDGISGKSGHIFDYVSLHSTGGGKFHLSQCRWKECWTASMFVVVSITIGASLAGILGMIISIPIASVIYELIKAQAQKRMDAKNSKWDPTVSNLQTDKDTTEK